jgi:hypothetical protein
MHSDPIGPDRASAHEQSRKKAVKLIAVAAVAMMASASLEAASLRGSRSSLLKQNRVAQDHNYSYLRTGAEVRQFVQHGYLVPVRSNANFELAHVSYPYARPEVNLFLNRLGGQYRAACGERLVVTSLTRPKSGQPSNASPLSVHPTGMAIDLRVPRNSRCRSWLESTLLSLERTGVLDATKEHRPPHYHVALFPRQYTNYVSRITGQPVRTASSSASSGGTGRVYTVRRGDTLWDIARSHNTTVATLKSANGMRSAMIQPGQKLSIP